MMFGPPRTMGSPAPAWRHWLLHDSEIYVPPRRPSLKRTMALVWVSQPQIHQAGLTDITAISAKAGWLETTGLNQPNHGSSGNQNGDRSAQEQLSTVCLGAVEGLDAFTRRRIKILYLRGSCAEDLGEYLLHGTLLLSPRTSGKRETQQVPNCSCPPTLDRNQGQPPQEAPPSHNWIRQAIGIGAKQSLDSINKHK